MINFKINRLILLFLSLLITCSGFLGLSTSASAAAVNRLDSLQFGSPEALITPIGSSISISDGAVGVEDGHYVMYTTIKGSPGTFNVVDLDDYKLLRTIELEGASDSWHHEVAPDGSVYVTAGKKLWMYSPVTKHIGVVATFGSEGPWSLVTDELGNAYVGTYPGGNVFKYDIATKEVTNYGRMLGVGSEEYVRSLGYHNGFIYAGTAHDKLIKLNLTTKEKTDITPSPTEKGFVYDMNVVDKRYLFARYGTSKTMYIYDLIEQKWLDVQLLNAAGLHVTNSLDGKVYFLADGKLKTYDLSTKEIAETTMEFTSSFRGVDWVEMKNDPDLPGKSLVTVRFDGQITFFNLQTNSVKHYRPVVRGNALAIAEMGMDSAGKIYVSSLAVADGAVYDPKTGKNEILTMGQSGSMLAYGNKLYMGRYAKARIYEFDTLSAISADNPKFTYQTGYGQDRVATMINANDKIFVGTISTYGETGGAVTIFDPKAETDNVRVFRNVVQDQSVMGLAYKDGLLYGSTNIKNGLGTDDIASEAKMFIMDAANGAKIKEFSPEIPGVTKPRFIGKLTIGPDGLLYGAALGHIFAMDTTTQKVVKSEVVASGSIEFAPWASVDFHWSAEGLLYALYGTDIYVIDPETLKSRFIAKAYDFVIGHDGHLYYAAYPNRTLLSRIKVTAGPDEPGGPGEDPGQPSEDVISVSNSSFEQPEVDGKIPGWTSVFAPQPTNYYEISNEKSNTGNKSLKVVDTSRNAGVALFSDKVNVLPNEEYTGKVNMFIESGQATLLMRYFDENNSQVAESLSHVSAGVNNWEEVQIKSKAPANAKYARIYASVSSYNVATVYYDDFNIIGNFPASETTAGTLSISAPAMATKDERLTASLNVTNASNLYATEAIVYYDPSKLKFEALAVSDAFKGGHEVFVQFSTSTPGKAHIIISHLGNRLVSGDLKVADITFKALEVAGNTQIKLDKNSLTAKMDADVTGLFYPLGQDQQIAVTIVQLLEDADGSGVVDIFDLIAVAKQVGAQVTNENRKLDINGDGRLDIHDMGLIAIKILK